MNALIKSLVIHSLALLLCVSAVFAQDRPAFSQQELDQMLAPIALYPDSLLSQVLMASTYPLEVVQAARWSRSRPELKGQEAVTAVEPMDWEPSVKSLVAFPQVLHMMDEKLDWTERLGEAFVAQEPQVMETVQSLRRNAMAAGQLGSNDRIRVTQQGDYIIIEPANPQVVRVPYYDPNVVYGSWGWPDYPPVYWGPPPGYYVASPPFTPGLLWSPGIVISAGFFFGHFDWHHRHVKVVKVVKVLKVHDRHGDIRVKRHLTVHDPTKIVSKSERVVWRHDPVHRRGVPFRHPAARQGFSRSNPVGGATRQDLTGRDATPAFRDRERPREFREVRPEGRTAGITPIIDTREAAPNRAVMQSDEMRADSRVAPSRTDRHGRALTSSEARGPGPRRLAPQDNDRRSRWQRDDSPPHVRSTQPLSIVPAPVGRIDMHPAGAVPGGDRHTRQPAASERGRRVDARSARAGGRVGQPGGVAPAFRRSFSGSNPGPRMGGGHYRSQGRGKSQGGGAPGQQSKGGKGRRS